MRTGPQLRANGMGTTRYVGDVCVEEMLTAVTARSSDLARSALATNPCCCWPGRNLKRSTALCRRMVAINLFAESLETFNQEML